MSVHIGEKIRQRTKQLRIGPTELGRLINTSKQNVNGIFKRRSIDSDLLKKLSKALEYDFFQYYLSEDTKALNEDQAVYQKSNEKTIKDLQKEIDRLKKELNEKEIRYLKKINNILEKKKK
jgi:hypothetical protein